MMNMLQTSGVLSAGTFAVGRASAVADVPAYTVSHTTLLHASQGTIAAAEAALKSLRGFRTDGRRIVWCNASELARGSDLRGLGRRFVETGGAQMVVIHGAGGR